MRPCLLVGWRAESYPDVGCKTTHHPTPDCRRGWVVGQKHLLPIERMKEGCLIKERLEAWTAEALRDMSNDTSQRDDRIHGSCGNAK
jgi:hypothetical protein